ncbi:hypothetical protein [Proteus columbae]|uniref:hypothetical protein n=1 Tax=Proteus columbae TaxID=1987580 RepID=UPI000C1ED3CF|nr:hypothetical protein [Proteus columbae]
MKKQFVFLSSLLFISLSGCMNNNEPPSLSIKNDNKIVKGIYIWGAETREFSSCDSSPTIWVEGDDKVMSSIVSTAIAKSEKAGVPLQPVYVEMDIQMLKGERDGFAENYPAAADIIKVYSVSENIPSNCHISTENK